MMNLLLACGLMYVNFLYNTIIKLAVFPGSAHS